MNDDEFICLPINVKNVFRLLAMRTTAEDEVFVKALRDDFDSYLSGIRQTRRLVDEKKFPKYLNYRGSHGARDSEKTQSISFEKMSEEQLCNHRRALFRDFGKSSIGRVIDYQVPLAHSQESAEGVVDLLAHQGDEVFLVEVKKWDSNEHPLRAMLEALTFWAQLVDEKKIAKNNAKNFVARYGEPLKELRQGMVVLCPAILIRRGSKIYDKMIVDVIEEPYAGIYKKVLRYVRCFAYDDCNGKLAIKEFTAEFSSKIKTKF